MINRTCRLFHSGQVNFRTTVILLSFFLLSSQQLFSQAENPIGIVIRDSITIMPKLPVRNFSIKTTTNVIDNGPLYTSRYSVSSTQITATGVRRVFLNATKVFEMACNPGGYGGSFFGTDTTVISSVGGVTVQAFKCVSGVYTAMAVTMTQTAATRYALFFDGKNGGELSFDIVPMPTLSISPRNLVVEVTKEYQPVIQFSESHRPATGEKYSPSVSWLTNNVIATGDYYWRFTDEDTVPVYISARAGNIRGSVTTTETAMLTVHRQPTKVEFQVSEDSLYTGDGSIISNLIIYDQFMKERNWSDEVHISAAPFGYGYFKLEYQNPFTHEPAVYSFTDEYLAHKFLKEGQLTFVAQNADPVFDIPVTLRIGMVQTYDAETGEPIEVSHEVPIVVQSEKLCPVVELSDSSVAGGDTIRVLIKGKDENGNIVDWRSTATVFKIEISNGNEYGDLLINGDRYDSYDGVNKETPIYFIADTANIPDSVTTTIRAWLSTAPLPAQALNANAAITASSDTVLVLERKRKALIVAPPPPEPSACDNSAEVKFNGLDHFEITLETEDIAFTESPKIFVNAKDENNNDVFVNDDAMIQLQLDGENAYGTFIKPNGDTIKTFREEFNLKYGEAKKGKARFAAVAANPQPSANLKILAIFVNKPTVFGFKEFTVKEQTLKIEMTGERAVQPLLPDENGVINTNEPLQENRKNFQVVWTRGGEPQPQKAFVLKTDYIDGSGGHDHIDPRRDNTQKNFGHFILIRTDAHQSQQCDGQIQANGKENYDYVASIFGDRMRIRVETAEELKKKLLWNEVIVTERVPGLINFRDAGTNGHWTFDQTPAGERRHHDNNWCTQGMADKLQAAINDFFNWTSSEEGGGSALILSLNDISLQFGGRFDIDGHWDQVANNHFYHRTGLSVDINNNSGMLKENGEWTEIGEQLVNIFKRYQLEPYPEETIHFGFNGGN